MSKTIKIIDLLNKIANGEEVPKKIKFGDYIYEWEEHNGEYWYFQTEITFYKEMFIDKNRLSEEVEIIEEQEEIDIQDIQELTNYEYNIGEMTDNEIARYHNLRSFKINQLVQAVKYLDNKLKEK